MRTLTEELPSSGSKSHEHRWQVLETKPNGDMVLVCRESGCGETKIVKKPVRQESQDTRRTICG